MVTLGDMERAWNNGEIDSSFESKKKWFEKKTKEEETAYPDFKKILALKDIHQMHRAWLKQYDGLKYSIAEDGFHKMKWQTEPKKYRDNSWSPEINMIARPPRQCRIEFDDKDADGKKDKIKIAQNISEVKTKLESLEIGYIESTHNGASNYLWIEFVRDMKPKELEQFMLWIAPKGSEVDLNFCSDEKVFPVLFAIHWKYSTEREKPIKFFYGKKIDFDGLGIKKTKISKQTIENNGFHYETAINKAIENQLSIELKNKFESPNLLQDIKEELSKNHIGDDNLKMTTFLTALSGLSSNPKQRTSMALKGDSSIGKDNVIKTVLRHMPKDSFIFLTSATQATIEDDILNKKIIAFSELNKNRDGGANKYLTEVLKQKAEGGTSSIKKDKRTDMKTARHDEGEQATVLYATTEADKDEELGTRFVEGIIKVDPNRILIVNNNTLDTYSDIDKLFFDSSLEDTWIRKALTFFYNNQKKFSILLPYASYLKEQIEGQNIFDNNNPRSQRDLKRLLSLTCAMTYLFQLQRKNVDYNGKLILISEPTDFINTLELSLEFFNQSYSGIDGRLSEVIKVMSSFGSGWIARDEIQEKLNISRNTIKSYCKTLADEGLIEGVKGVNLNNLEALNIYHGNKIYYKRCQKGINKPLIRCQVFKLKQFLDSKPKFDFDTFKQNIKEKGIKKKVSIIDKVNISDKNVVDTPKCNDFDTFELTPSKPSTQEEHMKSMQNEALEEIGHFICPSCTKPFPKSEFKQHGNVWYCLKCWESLQ